MSLRTSLNYRLTSALSAFVIGLCVCGGALAASGDVDPRLSPPVQNYADQAVPLPGAPPAQAYYDSPLAAGTLTLQDVLEAHKPNPESANLPAIGATPTSTATAPMLTPPAQSSSTSLMMSQGMRSVLQKVGETSPNAAPSQMRPPSLTGQPVQASGQPAALAPVATPVNVGLAPGVKYEPGQEPKNLIGEIGGASAAATVPGTPAPTVTGSTDTCDQNVQKWEKSCGDAGYPANYVGKIVGETHTGCADGALHDVWVTNSCAPPEAASAQTASTDAVCGVASNQEFDFTPSTNLCAQGMASAVTGEGPWNWACSGLNGGKAAACVARKRSPKSDGICGGANGVSTLSEPTADLCESGDSSPIKGSGPWTWSCRGAGGGSTQSCIAPLASPASVAASVAPIESASEVAVQAAASVPTPAPMVAASTPVSAPAGEKGELCGAAAETLAYDMPDKDLCRAGTASVVNGDGPWTWSCTNNEGTSSSCRTLSLSGGASEAPAPSASASDRAAEQAAAAAASSPTSPRVHPRASFGADTAAATLAPTPDTTSTELACGLAAAQSTPQAPSEELCVNGKASLVRGSGPWHWTCTNKAHHKVTCETPKVTDGSCGAANGAALKSAPFAGLCSAGTPTGIEGNGPWNWTCNGSGGGVNVSCAASVQTSRGTVDGTCGPTAGTTRPVAPTAGLCSTGVASAVSGDGPWNWSCSGSNGGSVSSCAASKVSPTQAPGPAVNGLCGDANGVLSSATPVDGLCSAGTATATVGNGPWNWSCLGQNGGMTVSCTAPLEPPAPIDGTCGQASGAPTIVRPQSALCASGITGIVSGHGPWTWTCSGANGGSPASCVAPMAGKTSGAMGSVSAAAVASNTSSADLAAPPAHAGLVTPRLPSANDDTLPPLDRKVMPRLSPSRVPAAASVSGEDVPLSAPDIAAGQEPVQPPSIRDSLAPAPALQDMPETAAERASHIPGNHLTLDPTISTVLFSRGSGNIDESVVSTLDRLSSVLASNPDVRITLTAYADNDGSSPRDARRLSLTRALAIRDYLASKGVSDSRVDVRAEGANTTSGYIDRVDVKVND